MNISKGCCPVTFPHSPFVFLLNQTDLIPRTRASKREFAVLIFGHSGSVFTFLYCKSSRVFG